MTKYSDGTRAEVGHVVEGVDNNGNAVNGVLLMIHRIPGKDSHEIAVSQENRMIGDLKASNFKRVDASKVSDPAPVKDSIKK